MTRALTAATAFEITRAVHDMRSKRMVGGRQFKWASKGEECTLDVVRGGAYLSEVDDAGGVGSEDVSDLRPCPMKGGLRCCSGDARVVAECRCRSCFRWKGLFDSPGDAFPSAAGVRGAIA